MKLNCKKRGCDHWSIGAFGLVKKKTENYIGKIPDNIRITELQKIVLLGTARILRRTLSIK